MLCSTDMSLNIKLYRVEPITPFWNIISKENQHHVTNQNFKKNFLSSPNPYFLFIKMHCQFHRQVFQSAVQWNIKTVQFPTEPTCFYCRTAFYVCRREKKMQKRKYIHTMHWVTYYMNALCILKTNHLYNTTLLAVQYMNEHTKYKCK